MHDIMNVKPCIFVVAERLSARLHGLLLSSLGLERFPVTSPYAICPTSTQLLWL